MKLSDAIRKGTQRFPKQCTENLFGVVDGQTATDALGAAIYGTFECQEGFMLSELQERYPELLGNTINGEMIDPGYQREFWLLRDQLVYFNDTLHWTREQIADWLEGNGL